MSQKAAKKERRFMKRKAAETLPLIQERIRKQKKKIRATFFIFLAYSLFSTGLIVYLLAAGS